MKANNANNKNRIHMTILIPIFALCVIVAACSKHRVGLTATPNAGTTPDGTSDPAPPTNSSGEKFVMVQSAPSGFDVVFVLREKDRMLDEKCVANKICNAVPKGVTSVNLSVSTSTAPRLKVTDWGVPNCAPFAGSCEIELAKQKKIEGSLVVVPIRTQVFARLQDIDPALAFAVFSNERSTVTFSPDLPRATLAIPKILLIESAFAESRMRSPKKKVGKVSRRTARTTFPVVVNFQFDEGSCEYRGSLGSQKVSVLKLQNCRDQITGNVLILSAAKAGEIAAELEAKPNEWWLLPKETRPQSVSIALRAKVTFESKLAMPLAIVNWARPTAPATAIAISPAKK